MLQKVVESYSKWKAVCLLINLFGLGVGNVFGTSATNVDRSGEDLMAECTGHYILMSRRDRRRGVAKLF